jgi:molybdenum ABC transporter molybdate-binding protein
MLNRGRISWIVALLFAIGLVPFGVRAQTPGPAPTGTPTTTPGLPSGFADPAFQRTWERTDLLANQGKIKRGYYWGPAPGEVKQEQYAEGQGGARLVQYFDKSRMEINNPNADKNNPFYVTNGLLTVELVTGRLQVGNNSFVDRSPANIPLASDADDANAPTYATFTNLVASVSDLTGQSVITVIDKAGNTDSDPSFASDSGSKFVHFEPSTGHNIPAVFWDFLNSQGPVVQTGVVVHAQLSNPWFYAAGYPITEPYWARVKIEGKPNTPVLVQLYQRRVLTYVPSLPVGFKVQVGNIGQHYYDWRYKNAGKPVPTATQPPVSSPTPLPTLGPTGLSVFAAASLKESFTEAGQKFKVANPNVTSVQFNFQGSQQLVAQLQQGAPGDVFASADKANMDRAVQAGLIDGAPRELVRNLLTVVLPNDNPGNVQTLQDLARPGLKISLADPSVPVGNYSLQVLDKLSADPIYGANYRQKVLDNVVSREDNVRQVLTRVQLGEVDAGIVYVTDAMAANSGSGGSVQPVQILQIPEQYNVVAIYYIGAVKGAAHPEAAQAWINYMLSDEGQSLLEKYGFTRANR